MFVFAMLSAGNGLCRCFSSENLLGVGNVLVPIVFLGSNAAFLPLRK